MDKDVAAALAEIEAGQDLTREASHALFLRVMSGAVVASDVVALLGALSGKGESVSELVGAAQAMRDTCDRVTCDAECIDTCGTGGDGISTFNVSTAAGIIASAAGATVAKHGNRSTTRVSGSTEVLGELGIDTDAPVDSVERSLVEARIGYLNARNLHPGMKHVSPVRASIPGRTIFNLLGPLCNPAGAKRQLLGVPRPELVRTMSEALLALGATHVWVVHGCDGLCDVTVSGETLVGEVRDGILRQFEICPEDGGVPRGTVDELRVSSPEESAAVMRGVLHGEGGAPRRHTLLNAGAALVVAGIASDIADGVELATRAVDSGAALATLELWRKCCGIR